MSVSDSLRNVVVMWFRWNEKKYIGEGKRGQRIAKNVLGSSGVLSGAVGVLFVDAAEVFRCREKEVE